MRRYPALSIERRQPRPRDKPRGIVGSLFVKLVVCSKALGCSDDSYLHVGVRGTKLTYSEEVLKSIVTKGLSERILHELARTMRITEHPFQRAGGRYAIFGSSIKGAVRSWLELSFRARGGVVPSCFVRAGRPLPSPPSRGKHGWRHFKMWGEVIFENRGPPCDPARGKVCVLCDLFGAAGLRALIEFGHFELAEGSVAPVKLAKGVEVEAAEPGSAFKGVISLRGVSADELGLLAIAMGLPHGETRMLGWGKYRERAGPAKFGRVHYETLKMKLLPGSERELSKLGKFVDPFSLKEDELALALEKARALALERWGDYLREVRIPEFG